MIFVLKNNLRPAFVKNLPRLAIWCKNSTFEKLFNQHSRMVTLVRNCCFIIAAIALIASLCITKRRIQPTAPNHRSAVAIVSLLSLCALFTTGGIVLSSRYFTQCKYQNIEPTPQFTPIQESESTTKAERTPSQAVEAYKTDLKVLNRNDNLLVWLGHSTIYLQVSGKRFLVDPILCSSFPSKLMLRPFAGSDIWTTDDIPDIDYLIITHDHWDHLDKATLRCLAPKIAQVYCGLDVGEHLRSCGFSNDAIHEMQWNDSLQIDPNLQLHCLTSRHFSGRWLRRNPTLWASWMIEGDKTVFVSGDGGYGKHFKAIGERFSNIHLAIMENGQYNMRWRHIHMLPSELPTAISDLRAQKVFTYHHGKYSLSTHDWREPSETIRTHAQGAKWELLDQPIGTVVHF